MKIVRRATKANSIIGDKVSFHKDSCCSSRAN